MSRMQSGPQASLPASVSLSGPVRNNDGPAHTRGPGRPGALDPGCAYRPIHGPQDLATGERRSVHSLERACGPLLPGSWPLGPSLSLTASSGTCVAWPGPEQGWGVPRGRSQSKGATLGARSQESPRLAGLLGTGATSVCPARPGRPSRPHRQRPESTPGGLAPPKAYLPGAQLRGHTWPQRRPQLSEAGLPPFQTRRGRQRARQVPPPAAEEGNSC